MTVHSESFRSINKITKWLLILSIATIVFALINTGAFFALDYQTRDVQLQSTDLVFLIIATLILVIEIVALIMTLYWFYRANKNIHAFGAKEVSSPIMAVIWWFIPILDLWKPHSVAQQIWKASNPQIILSNGIEWKNSPRSNVILLWWILLLLSIFIGIPGEFLNPPESEQLSYNNTYTEQSMPIYEGLLNILSTIPAIISTFLFMRIIRQISSWQEIKSGKSI
jgi:heme/copper-type cytochrome/quinol oxidase subunit 2